VIASITRRFRSRTYDRRGRRGETPLARSHQSRDAFGTGLPIVAVEGRNALEGKPESGETADADASAKFDAFGGGLLRLGGEVRAESDAPVLRRSADGGGASLVAPGRARAARTSRLLPMSRVRYAGRHPIRGRCSPGRVLSRRS